MNDAASNVILEFAFNNIIYIGMLVMGIAASGTVLGGVRKLVAARPRATLIGLAVLTLIGGGYVAVRGPGRTVAQAAAILKRRPEPTPGTLPPPPLPHPARRHHVKGAMRWPR